MERLKTDRTYWLAFVLAFIPLGWIYTLWFFYDAIKSLNIACGAKEGPDYNNKKSPGFIAYLLLSIFTMSIYQLYWLWKQGNRMTEVGEKYGIVSQYLDPERKKFKEIIICIVVAVILGVCCVFVPFLFLFFGIGLFIAALIQASAYNTFFKDLNILCEAYNSQVIDGIVPNEGVKKIEGGGGNQIEDKGDGERRRWEQEDRERREREERERQEREDREREARQERERQMREMERKQQELEERERQMREMERKQREQEERKRQEREKREREMAKTGGVRMVSGEYAGSEIRLAPGEKIVIGRNPKECSLVCSSEKVSRVHLEIEYVERFTGGSVPPGAHGGAGMTISYYLATDHSTNGTVSSECGKLPPNKQVRQYSGAVLTLGQSEEAVKLL